MAACLSREEENYVRMNLLVNGISQLAVRTYFDQEFHPDCLEATLKKNTFKLSELAKKNKINKEQWNLLYPPAVPKSENFDISLMIILLRNLTDMVPPHGGYDDLPATNETAPAADLARIKYFRNYLAHLECGKIGTEKFNKAWTSITESIVRLGGEQMKLECDKLKNKNLDQTNHELMVKSHEGLQQMKESFGAFVFSQNEMKEAYEDLMFKVKYLMNAQKDKIPWAIREIQKEEVSRWQSEDHHFAETIASNRLFTSISKQDTGLVTVVGPRGCGKSFLTKHVALQMKDQHGYEIIPVQGLREILEYNQSGYRQLFVFDDQNQNVKEWTKNTTALQTRLNGKVLKIIACYATDIYEDPEFQEISLLCEHKFDLKAAENMLSDEDVESIATCHMKKEEFAEIKGMTEKLKKLDNFPFLCRKFADQKLENASCFFDKYISVKLLDTKVDVKVESNTSNTLTMNSEQLVQDLFSKATIEKCQIQIFNGGTHYHK